MIIGPRRMALIGAIVAVALAIIFYPLIVYTPFDPNDVSLDLSEVTLASGGQDVQRIDLRVCLNVTNRSNFTLTTSKIDYELFADGQAVGSDTISYEDIPVNGRPALFTNKPITICDMFTLEYADARADLFNRILNNSGEIGSWRVTGNAIIESGTTFQERQFTSEL